MFIDFFTASLLFLIQLELNQAALKKKCVEFSQMNAQGEKLVFACYFTFTALGFFLLVNVFSRKIAPNCKRKGLVCNFGKHAYSLFADFFFSVSCLYDKCAA